MNQPTRAAAALAFAFASAAAFAPQTALAAEAMRVVRDPGTGELRAPTAAEAAAFEKAEQQLRAGSGRQRATTPRVEVRYPDGTVETKLDEDTVMYSVVRVGADGALTMNCLPGKEAQAFVKGSKTSTTARNAATKAHHADH